MSKVLIVNTTFEKGGAAQIARDLFFNFKKNKEFSVFFAYGRGGKNLEKNTFYFGNKIEFFIHLFLVRFLGLEGFGSYFSTIKLIKFIKKEKFDLIHIHNLHGYYVNFFKLLEYFNKKNIKVIWTLHDEWLFTWLPAHSMGCAHCKTLRGKCVNRYYYPKNYFPLFSKSMLKKKRNILLFNNITFICPADWLYREAKDEFGLSNSLFIANGVDSNFFAPSFNKNDLREKYSLPKDKKIIIFSVNNFEDENKGGRYFLELAEILKEKPYKLCVIGSANIPQSDNLFNFGYIVERKKLAEILSLSDLYCFFSAVETAPLSVLEAMSSGLSIAGFNIKALKNLVSEKNGLLVNYADVKKLAEKICNFFSDDQLSTEMGEYSRKIVLNNFEQSNNYLLYEKIYKL